MNLHNFRTVVTFEFLRTITKRRFWVLSLSVPILIGLVFALSAASASSKTSDSNSAFTFTYHDASGLVTQQIAAAFGGTPTSDPAAAQQAVKDGTSDAFFDIPADVGTAPIAVYGKDIGLMSNGRYSSVAQSLVKTAAIAKIGNKQLASISASTVPTDQTIYRNGSVAPGFASIILPLAFILLFYLSIMMLGQQMLNVTLEEKENRVSEMILTTMNPTTLIIGKVVALIGVGILQSLVFSVPVFIARFVAPNALKLPAGLKWSDIPIDPVRLVVGFLIFIAGFALFTGFLVAIGAVMPTAREAGGAFSAVIIAMFVPFYALQLIINQPHSLLPTVFTYFPLTAPITALLRNAFGSLSWYEAIIVIVELAAVAGLMLRIGVRLFQTGSISYGSKVNIREALRLAR